MCIIRKPSPPPTIVNPVTVAPPASDKTQGGVMPAGYTGRNKKFSPHDRKRVGASHLRIPIIGGV